MHIVKDRHGRTLKFVSKAAAERHFRDMAKVYVPKHTPTDDTYTLGIGRTRFEPPKRRA